MNRTRAVSAAGLVVAAGAGALLMYLLDPQQGRRRRALVRDQAVRLAHRGSELADAAADDDSDAQVNRDALASAPAPAWP